MTIETLAQKWASGAIMSAPLLAVTCTRRFGIPIRTIATVPLLISISGYTYFTHHFTRRIPFN